MTTIFIECGTTLNSMAHTGIQRVVRSVLQQATPGHFPGDEFQPVVFDGYHLLLAPSLLCQPDGAETVRQIASRTNGIARRFALRFFPHAWLCLAKAQWRQLRGYLMPPPCAADDALKQVVPGPDGKLPILLLLDSSWRLGLWKKADAFRAQGGHVSAVLYDLIPFTHPDTVQDATKAAHTAWWSEAPNHLDSLLCISRTVREEFLAWQSGQDFARPLPPEKVGYFHLGSELPKTRTEKSDIMLPPAPYFLTVGTLEPRKNHAIVLDAFERLWQDGVDATLVIVGVFGWKSESLLERIRHHPESGRRLLHKDRASDHDLAALYDGAKAVISASLAEGFGLPVVEAYQRGKPVLCSDIPVFHEVAGPHALYFDPRDAGALASRVKEALAARGALPAEGKQWITWKDSAQQLFTRLKAMAA